MTSIEEKIIGVKELRQNLDKYIAQVKKGGSFTVVKRSRPVFKISPVGEGGLWELVTDFTKVKKGGIKIDELLGRL